MKVEISVAEMIQVFNKIQEQPEKILEMVKADMPQAMGGYLSEIMRLELTEYLGRQPYERTDKSNHRNGSYPRRFTLKGIGEVPVLVPRDRKGEYQTQVIPRSKRYEDELRQDIAVNQNPGYDFSPANRPQDIRWGSEPVQPGTGWSDRELAEPGSFFDEIQISIL